MLKGFNRFLITGTMGLAMLGSLGIVPSLAQVFGDQSTKRYHTPECPESALIKKPDLKVFDSEAEAQAKAFYPCTVCSAAASKRTPVVEQRKLSQVINRGEGYVVDLDTHVYHLARCPLIRESNSKRLRKVLEIEKASAGGNSPCATCHPPMAFIRIQAQPDVNSGPVAQPDETLKEKEPAAEEMP